MQVTPLFNFVRQSDIKYYRKNFEDIKKFFDDQPQEVSLNKQRKLYKHFFEGEVKNFTRSKLAKWEMFRTNPEKYPHQFKNFLNALDKSDELQEIKTLRAKAIQKKQRLYPKTSLIREILAQESRVVFDKVQPKTGYFQKLLLKMRMYIL